MKAGNLILPAFLSLNLGEFNGNHNYYIFSNSYRLILMVMFKSRLYIGSFSVESFWVISLMGAILLIMSLSVSLFEVYEKLTSSSGMNPIKLLIIFISMS